MLDLKRLSNDAWLLKELNALLQDKLEVDFGSDYGAWMYWLWQREPVYKNYYTEFKGLLYRHLDPKFETYFSGRDHSARIRVDEIVWGGVQQDGIPPLRYPKMIDVQEAGYLKDDNVVFGLAIDGIVRAYPQRILAWHEFFVDRFGDKAIAGVYCTLCGTVIAYDMRFDGTLHDLGTSGFLYRSNKLMYDRATQSLWNTIEGKPVMGPLVDKGIELKSYPLVTTTWGEWKALHPQTQVLSLDTGHDRDYSEGHAYQAYFSTDELMFPVPKVDGRLSNKDEVFVIRSAGYKQDPLAINVKYLQRKLLHQDQIGQDQVVILTDRSGASRAYLRKSYQFESYKKEVLKDDSDRIWAVTEDYLIHPNGTKLERLPAHQIFWFAWFNTYPETRLVK